MHPGIFIKRVYVKPFDIGLDELANKLLATPDSIQRLLDGNEDVSPTMALKLSKVLGRSPESWLIMRDNYNLWQARKERDLNSLERFSFAA